MEDNLESELCELVYLVVESSHQFACRQRTAIVNGGIYLSNLIYYLVSLFISMNVDVA